MKLKTTTRKSLSKKVRELVLTKYDSRCAYCGCDLTIKSMQVDHIVPVDKSGSNDLSNLNPSCRSCNFYKGVGGIEYLRKMIKTLHERLNKTFIYRLAKSYGMIKEREFEGFYFEQLKRKE